MSASTIEFRWDSPHKTRVFDGRGLHIGSIEVDSKRGAFFRWRKTSVSLHDLRAIADECERLEREAKGG